MAYLKIQFFNFNKRYLTHPIMGNVNGRVHSGICDNANQSEHLATFRYSGFPNRNVRGVPIVTLIGKERKFTFHAIITLTF